VHFIYRKPKKWLLWQCPLGAGYRQYLHSVGQPLKPPLHCLVAIGISIGLAVFAEMTAECPYTLHWDALPPSKLPLRMGRSGPPYNMWFRSHARVLNPDN